MASSGRDRPTPEQSRCRTAGRRTRCAFRPDPTAPAIPASQFHARICRPLRVFTRASSEDGLVYVPCGLVCSHSTVSRTRGRFHMSSKSFYRDENRRPPPAARARLSVRASGVRAFPVSRRVVDLIHGALQFTCITRQINTTNSERMSRTKSEYNTLNNDIRLINKTISSSNV